MSSAIRTGLVTSAHDCSEGGVLVAAAEMAFAGGIGLSLDFDVLPGTSELLDCAAFGETPGRYLLEVHPDRMDAVHEQLGDVPMTRIGTFNESRPSTSPVGASGRWTTYEPPGWVRSTGEFMTKALVITTTGINCDLELAEAFVAGATPVSVHLNRLLHQPELVEEFDLVGLPGGFSYGDAVAAGRIAAQLIRSGLYDSLRAAVSRGVPMIAPCNGFQIAVQVGLLPDPSVSSTPPVPTVALADNTSARFIDRWVRFSVPTNTTCVWTRGLQLTDETAVIPIAHGEGRFVPSSTEQLQQLEADGCCDGHDADDNPNGSAGDVAGLCDPPAWSSD